MTDTATHAAIEIQKDFPPVSPQAWRELVDKDLAGAPFEKKLIAHLYEGIDVQPLYTDADWPHQTDSTDLPGFAPLTRGGYLLGHVTCGWDVRQEHAHPDLAVSNHAILEDLKRGVTSALLRLDVAGRHGQCPEHVDHEDWLGQDGLMVYSVRDLEELLQGVYLEMAILAMEAGAAFLPAAGLLIGLSRKKNIDPQSLRVHFNADPLAVLARDGHLPSSLDQSLRQMAQLAVFSNQHLPACRSVRVGTAPYHHAGATAAQDLAWSMATAVQYLRAMTQAGMSVDEAAKQMIFSFGLGTNVFLAISKMRAARKLWASVLESCGATVSVSAEDTSSRMVIHARTSKRVMTQRDPWVNLLRNTVTCFAAGVGGADIITTEPFDRALGLPDSFSRRIARNTQIILQEESHLGRVIDPAGGCWFIESLTESLCGKAWSLFQEIEAAGGMATALETGMIQKQIESAFAPRLKNLATRKDAITGVSEFPNLTEKPLTREKPDLASLITAAHMRAGTQTQPQTSLASVRPVQATGLLDSGCVEACVSAAVEGASLGDLFSALSNADEPTSTIAIAPHPYAEPFERLRDASDAHLALTGGRPRVFLANLGPVAHFTARAAYSRNFFEAGGFEVIQDPKGHQGSNRDDVQGLAENAAAAMESSGAEIAVICSSDKLYEVLVPTVAATLKARGARTLILAGAPGENRQIYEKAGVDRFIFLKCDVLQVLRELLAEEGVL